ncbi:CLUMA_CG001669, isoform A [Clunio marinus]|uniref:CLUMA_CG001669, isoform A n=1 Tax=Clunio marinus TaxID=568069 RepID=A0A1J1HK07_9DIPT|nr:CLUMA_CG001669, isoform A [Clunio marinus]
MFKISHYRSSEQLLKENQQKLTKKQESLIRHYESECFVQLCCIEYLLAQDKQLTSFFLPEDLNERQFE